MFLLLTIIMHVELMDILCTTPLTHHRTILYHALIRNVKVAALAAKLILIHDQCLAVHGKCTYFFFFILSKQAVIVSHSSFIAFFF